MFSDTAVWSSYPLNALAGVLIVNGLAKAFGSSPSQEQPREPSKGPFELAEGKGTLKEMMCDEEARNQSVAEAIDKIDPSKQWNNYKPTLPVKPGPGIFTKLLYWLRIIKPLDEATSRREQLYEACMARTDNNI